MKAEDTCDVVSFMFEAPQQDRIADFELKLMDIDAEQLGIPDTDYSAKCVVNSAIARPDVSIYFTTVLQSQIVCCHLSIVYHQLTATMLPMLQICLMQLHLQHSHLLCLVMHVHS